MRAELLEINGFDFIDIQKFYSVVLCQDLVQIKMRGSTG